MMFYAEIVETAWDCIAPSHERGESAQYYVLGHDSSGSIEPHYPVPAISLYVDIGPRSVVVFDNFFHMGKGSLPADKTCIKLTSYTDY